MKPKLSNKDFCRAAKKLRCEVSAIKAVSEVESRGDGFYPNDFPTLLFERHIFRKYTQGRYNKSHPHLSGAPGNYGKAGQNQRNKFNEAFALNPDAAMKSCSWGKFQIMGFNHAICGYATVGEFIDAMKESEGKQLDGFVSFVIANNLAIHLRNLNWTSFAKGYNGAGYAKNRYDKKMATAYTKYARENINCNQLSGEDSTQTATSSTPTEGQVPPITTDEPATTSPETIVQNAEQIINTGDATNIPPPESKELAAPSKDGATSTATKMTIGGIVVPGFIVAAIKTVQDFIEQGYVSAAEVGSTVLGFIKEHQKYVFLLIGLLIVLLIVKKVVKQVTFWLELISKAVPQFNNITVVPTEVEAPSKWWQIWK